MIEMGKQYRTKGGSLARILCVDAPGEYPVIAMLPEEETYTIRRYTKTGRAASTTVVGWPDLDLVEVAPVHTTYYNLYSNGLSVTYNSLISARAAPARSVRLLPDSLAPKLLYRVELKWSEDTKPTLTVIE